LSRGDRKEVQTSSTVEAIRMASASVLGITTGLGYPVGSALGTGNVLEEHSESASMNIAPLIFSVRDTLRSAENLELLSIEWDLEHRPGPEVVPEQLVVAGGSEGGTGSHVCVLTWEKGVVDPFKIDAYMKILSKKIADIETAVVNNEITYEPNGLAVLRNFADRLNSVLFVDMIDRRFQGSWDSQQVKADQVEVDLHARMAVRDDYTTLPPGPKVLFREELEFKMSALPDQKGIEQFKNRVLTPSAVKTLTEEIPEAGQAILREMNEYAYSQEEADIARSLIEVLKELLGKDRVSLNELGSLRSQIEEFGSYLESAVKDLEVVVEDHVSSGKSLDVNAHKEALLSAISDASDIFTGVKRQIAEAVTIELMKSVSREFQRGDEVKAWELKSTLRYSVDHAKRISHYFTDELEHYLITEAARNAFQAALAEFRSEVLTEDMDSTDRTLFEKLYGEIQAQLSAAFARAQRSRHGLSDLPALMETATRGMIDAFRLINVWSLIGFDDVSGVAQSEIEKKYSVPASTGNLTEEGKSLMAMLQDFQTLVSDTIPDVADTILSKQIIRRMIDSINEENSTVLQELASAVEGAAEKPDVWKSEAREWIEDFKAESVNQEDTTKAFLALMQFVHEKLGAAVTPSAMADRVKAEADLMESQYQAKVDEWNELRERTEAENARIRATNERREQLLREAREKHAAETSDYEARLTHYRDLMEQRRIQSVRVTETGAAEGEEGVGAPPPMDLGPPPEEPTKPKPIEPELEAIRAQYPEESEKAIPPSPEPDPLMTRYMGLRDVLHEKLTEMKEREKSMEELFAKRVLRLQAEGMEAAKSVSMDISASLYEHLMNTRIRRLGGLLPRVSRVYLRDPSTSNLIYVVSYEQSGDTMSVSMGSAYLR
jgi:hypothetical protein